MNQKALRELDRLKADRDAATAKLDTLHAYCHDWERSSPADSRLLDIRAILDRET